MKQKFIAYALVPVLAAGILGAGIVSAHGGFSQNLSPDEIASHQAAKFEQKAHQEQTKQSILAQMRSHLQALVDKGVITQAQADARLKVMTDRFAQKQGKGHIKWHGFGHEF